MTYGFTVNGEGNNLVFSTDTDNFFYQGKASYYNSFPSTNGGFDYLSNTSTANLLNSPWGKLYEFRITLPSQVTNILPFIYNPFGKRVAVVSTVKLDSTTWQIYLVSCIVSVSGYDANANPVTNQPTVYIFANYIDVNVNTGYGINVFSDTSKVLFTTNEKPLLIKALYNGNVRYSDAANRVYSGVSSPTVGPDRSIKYISYINPVNTVGDITKAAIFYSSPQSARAGDIVENVYESTAVYSNTTKQLGIEWAIIGSAGIQLPDIQSTVTPFTAMVIDGSEYD